jgi:hypothetical protein
VQPPKRQRKLDRPTSSARNRPRSTDKDHTQQTTGGSCNRRKAVPVIRTDGPARCRLLLLDGDVRWGSGGAGLPRAQQQARRGRGEVDSGRGKGKRQPRRTNNTTDTEGIDARTEDARSERRQTCRQISRIPFRITKQTDVEHTVRHQRARYTRDQEKQRAERQSRPRPSSGGSVRPPHGRHRRSAEAAR